MARTVPGERYQPRLHTIDETAARLRVCSRTVWRLIERGTGPPTVRIGRKVFIRSVDLEGWLLTRVSQQP
jgi:excisionase family DNA binding protein